MVMGVFLNIAAFFRVGASQPTNRPNRSSLPPPPQRLGGWGGGVGAPVCGKQMAGKQCASSQRFWLSCGICLKYSCPHLLLSSCKEQSLNFRQKEKMCACDCVYVCVCVCYVCVLVLGCDFDSCWHMSGLQEDFVVTFCVLASKVGLLIMHFAPPWLDL